MNEWFQEAEDKLRSIFHTRYSVSQLSDERVSDSDAVSELFLRILDTFHSIVVNGLEFNSK